MNIFDKTGNIATIAINQLIRSNVRQSLSLNCVCCKFFSITLTTLLTFIIVYQKKPLLSIITSKKPLLSISLKKSNFFPFVILIGFSLL